MEKHVETIDLLIWARANFGNTMARQIWPEAQYNPARRPNHFFNRFVDFGSDILIFYEGLNTNDNRKRFLEGIMQAKKEADAKRRAREQQRVLHSEEHRVLPGQQQRVVIDLDVDDSTE